jgi:hypothetical protein
MQIERIKQTDDRDSKFIAAKMGKAAPAVIYYLGNIEIVKHRLLGFICSIRCPGSTILKTFDAVRELRDKGMVFIGGFHSPMERECLDLILRGPQPVILCPPPRVSAD